MERNGTVTCLPASINVKISREPFVDQAHELVVRKENVARSLASSIATRRRQVSDATQKDLSMIVSTLSLVKNILNWSLYGESLIQCNFNTLQIRIHQLCQCYLLPFINNSIQTHAIVVRISEAILVSEIQKGMEEKVHVPGYILEKRNEIQNRMIECGEMDRLEEYLRKKLIASGWKENLKTYCKDIIREKGIERVTVQGLMEELEKRGKHTIPVAIREDMLSRVRKFVEDSNAIK